MPFDYKIAQLEKSKFHASDVLDPLLSIHNLLYRIPFLSL